MRSFNKDDYDKVKEYHKDFEKAVNSLFVTGLQKQELDAVAQVYKECLNRTTNLSCGSCVLTMMINVGQLYFNYIRQTEQEEKDEKDHKRKTGKRSTGS